MNQINKFLCNLNSKIKIEKSKISKYSAAASKLFLSLLLKPILPLKINLCRNTFLREVQILKIESPNPQPFYPLTMRYLNSVTSLPSLIVGQIESIMKIIIIHLDAILFRQDLDAFQYDLLHPLTTVMEAQLDDSLIVAEEDFEILILGA